MDITDLLSFESVAKNRVTRYFYWQRILKVFVKGLRKATATQAIFTRDCSAAFRNYCVAIARKIATQLHSAMAKFAERYIARIFRVINISATFQKMLHCQRKTCYTQKFVRATAMKEMVLSQVSHFLFENEVLGHTSGILITKWLVVQDQTL